MDYSLLPPSLLSSSRIQFSHSSMDPFSKKLQEQERYSFPIKKGKNKKEEKVQIILYTTSLRGIRRTHEDCCSIRSLLRALRIAVDERDVSMDSAFRRQLQSLLRPRPVSLPQMFVGGRHVGGAEEVRQLHEEGKLAKILDGA